jgi:hypothetical protein
MLGIQPLLQLRHFINIYTQIESDINKLQMQVDQEQEELNKLLNTQKDRRMVNISEDQKLISFETFKVSHKMNLVQQEAAHILLIDSQLPIDCLMIQSM